MRIALVTGIFPPDVGGPATYVPTIATALVARGHDVRVITTSEPADLRHDDRYRFPVLRVDRRTSILRRTLRVAAEVARAARRADVIYANGMFLEAALAARLSRRALVAKVVGDEAWERSTARGWTRLDLDAFQKATLPPRLRALAVLRSYGTRAADHVIVPSRYLQRIVTGWGVDPQRCSVVYNAVAASGEQPRAASADGPLRLLTAGRLVPWKGVDLLIRALRGLDGTTLDVVGDGPCRGELETLARRAGVDTRVRFVGRTGPDALHALMRAGDVFVLASSYEGLPHVLLEAMQQGMTVVATRAGGTPEVVEDAETGLLVERTVDALRAALERLRRDPSLRARLAEGGRRMVASRFDHETMVARTEQVLARAGRGLRLVCAGSDRWGHPLTVAQRKKLVALDGIGAVTVLGYRRPGTPPPRLDGVRFALASAHGGPLRRAARLALLSVRTTLGVARRARRVVVTGQSPYEGGAALVARALARLGGADVRVVVEAHGDWVEVGRLLGRFPSWSRPLVRGVGRLVLSHADAIRTVSAFTADLVRTRSRAPVVTFPAFTDLDVFLSVPAESERRHLLYAGVLTPVKGVDLLLDALALLAGGGQAVPLIVAGDGPERAALEQQTERLGLGSWVTFRGHVGQDVLGRLMASAHAVVLPSHSEGLGLVLMEALACGTPVVASDVGGIEEIVRDGHNGRLVVPGDARALAGVLADVLRDLPGTRAMGERGRAEARERFAPDAWAAGQRVLIDVATRPGRASSSEASSTPPASRAFAATTPGDGA